MKTVIRRAVQRDVPRIKAIILNAYEKYVDRLGKEPAPMSANYSKLVSGGDVWVLATEGEAAGLIVLTEAGDHLLVSNMAVSSDRQGNGFGRRLLDHAEEQARARGFDELRLFTNAAMCENLAIYERLGWSEYDRAEQNGFDRVFMKKSL